MPVIPLPVQLSALPEGSYRLTDASRVRFEEAALEGVAAYLGELLSVPTSPDEGDIVLTLEGDEPEGYALRASENGIRIGGGSPAGVFYGVQTLRQLVQENRTVEAVEIADAPRYAYRGAMLDVARHFFGVDDVKRYLDDIALLKLNHLHLHLTDDQGWRLQIDAWPELTGIGASTRVGGGGGGFYTKDDYREIVAYAASSFVTIVPEIDMPGHTNAALASYAELNTDGIAPEPYEGIEVGFSSLDSNKPLTYDFVRDVLTELADLTPGPYLHIGGDESLATTDADFLLFVRRAAEIAASLGKTVIGWHEMGRSRELPPGTIGHYWNFSDPREGNGEHALSFVEQGGQLIISPGDRAYLDMKYDESTELGLVWADGPTPVPDSYEWDPALIVPGVGEEHILGVEAPLWTETVTTIDEIEFMAFPRLACVAELGWSPRTDAPRHFEEIAQRLARLGGLWDALGVQYYRAPEVEWGGT